MSCSRHQKISIVPLTMLDRIDSIHGNGQTTISKANFYLVKGFADNDNSEKFIDHFVETNKATNPDNYTQYDMTFYKESNETNPENIIQNSRVIDRYSQNNDWIYSYGWMKGKFMGKWKVRNGEIVDPKSHITVEDIPK